MLTEYVCACLHRCSSRLMIELPQLEDAKDGLNLVVSHQTLKYPVMIVLSDKQLEHLRDKIDDYLESKKLKNNEQQ